MTYAPKPIDFCDHVGHGMCGDCPDEPETVEDTKFTREQHRIAADVGFAQSTERGHQDYEAGRYETYDSAAAMVADLEAIDITVDDATAAKLDRMSPAEQAFAVNLALGMIDPYSVTSLAPEPLDVDHVDDLREQLYLANRELERWRHGVPIEGDYVCEYAFDREQLTEMRLALVGLLDAFPRLGSEYATADMQAALRAARKAVGR